MITLARIVLSGSSGQTVCVKLARGSRLNRWQQDCHDAMIAAGIGDEVKDAIERKRK